MDPELSDLWQEICGLHMLVYMSPHASESTKARFLAVIDSYPDGIPPRPMLLMLREFFYGLPESEQRAILNGWRPCVHRPDDAAVWGEAHEEQVMRRTLTLHPHAMRANGKDRIYAEQRFELVNHQDCGMRLNVYEGTPLADVLEFLRESIRAVERDGAAMLDGLPVNFLPCAQQKNLAHRDQLDGNADGSFAAVEFTQAPCDAGDATARRELAGAAA